MKKITFLFGGNSDEHEISVKSFKNINEHAQVIENIKFDHIYIDKNGKWSKSISDTSHIYWPIIHGKFGEDGQVQKLLEKKGLNYIGSSSLSSMITFDKLKTQKVLARNNIKTPKTLTITKLTKGNLNKIQKFSLPLFIKPNKNGSSVGLLKLNSFDNLEDKIVTQLKNFGKILVQEYVAGREFTCGVIRKGNKFLPLVPTEIVLTKGKIFDYQNKYYSKKQVEVTPPKNLQNNILKEIKKLSLRCHKILKLRDYSRTDIIMNSNGELVVLEINSIPGMTENSILPQQMDSMGIETEKFIRIMVKNFS